MLRPVNTKDLCQFLEVLSCCLPDGEDSVSKPAHAEVSKLLIEESHAQLLSQERDVLDDGQSHTPLLVFGKSHDRREKGLGEELDANN